MKTGKQASQRTEKYLLNVQVYGEAKRYAFVDECKLNNARFEQPIQKQNIMNFAMENFEKRNKSKKAQQIAQTKGTRDMLGRLLFLSVKMDIDISKVFCYPLLPEPPCFAHPDGSLRESPKSKVFEHLTKDRNCELPASKTTFVGDGMFVLRSEISNCSTYGALARKMLFTVMNGCDDRGDLCFDVYESPSIKDIERKDRGDADSCRMFSIGSKTKIEKDATELLKYSSFKNELLRFLSEEFKDPIYAPFIGTKVFYCAINNTCTKHYNVEGEYRFVVVDALYGDHLEADTRVMFHAAHAEENNPGNIVIRGNDADICIIMIMHAHKINKSILWYSAGQNYNNKKKCEHPRTCTKYRQ